MADYTYDEKRDFARMSIETQVTYTVKNTDETSYHGVSTDLSATGLAMTTDYKLTVGDQIDIVMNGADSRLPPFVAEGSVLRVDLNDDKTFDVSISLTVK